MENIQMALIDMGFPKERVQKALQVNASKVNTLESAMEWLLAHSDDYNEEMNIATDDGEASSSTSTDLAKSMRCDECLRLFKTNLEVEFHAAKSGHSNFSESTEEKKPLTEDEKKEQLAKLEEKMRRKRIEREESEKKDSLEKERLRIKSGKDMLEAKKLMEEEEVKKMIDQRKREKMEEKLARDRVRAQIESDKVARRVKAEVNKSPNQFLEQVPASPSQKPIQSKIYTQTRIQIRLLDGTSVQEVFNAKEELSAVRLFIKLKMEGSANANFNLITSFPRRVFSEENNDFDQSLESLGLVPSAVLIVTRKTTN